jgi:hypothetical protein
MFAQLFNEETYSEAQKLVLPKHISSTIYICFEHTMDTQRHIASYHA